MKAMGHEVTEMHHPFQISCKQRTVICHPKQRNQAFLDFFHLHCYVQQATKGTVTDVRMSQKVVTWPN
ncbi:hypothetical protein BDA96_07G087900 [Sorghum bicolor]|uniref:Uncharacterized protein n=1 Tax=Sorghum bicolor TaxID=4558 RepID=A0A921QJT7_SORBI|nr:hypothetical protein BDA96_07G087900 [Sorghum bicolor]